MISPDPRFANSRTKMNYYGSMESSALPVNLTVSKDGWIPNAMQTTRIFDPAFAKDLSPR